MRPLARISIGAATAAAGSRCRFSMSAMVSTTVITGMAPISAVNPGRQELPQSPLHRSNDALLRRGAPLAPGASGQGVQEFVGEGLLELAAAPARARPDEDAALGEPAEAVAGPPSPPRRLRGEDNPPRLAADAEAAGDGEAVSNLRRRWPVPSPDARSSPLRSRRTRRDYSPRWFRRPPRQPPWTPPSAEARRDPLLDRGRRR